MISLVSITRLFPLWAAFCAFIAYYHPSVFIGFKPYMAQLLMLIMLAMGVTLHIDDFSRVLRRPVPVAAGLALHYLVMPLAAWIIARILHMPPELQAGMVLVGCVASGTASNVMVFLAKGDVALSVTISVCSTLIGVVATPLLTHFYIASSIHVPIESILIEIIQIVILPITAGLLLNRFAHKAVKNVLPLLPLFSMCLILLALSTVVALSQHSLNDLYATDTAYTPIQLGWMTVLGVLLHNAIGLLSGYWGGRLLGFDKSICRTLAFEVGMQNSGLAAVLGLKFVSALAALPAAFFSVWHNISGALLAGFWSDKAVKPEDKNHS
ncbi:bile acid:sodium symporter family protein [Neisseriaceae bacterium ESL0693]|nr:bile acid:sodium symporter family protein [Neisseriaceae bacterium ESL0693]